LRFVRRNIFEKNVTSPDFRKKSIAQKQLKMRFTCQIVFLGIAFFYVFFTQNAEDYLLLFGKL